MLNYISSQAESLELQEQSLRKQAYSVHLNRELVENTFYLKLFNEKSLGKFFHQSQSLIFNKKKQYAEENVP
ncbi:MAG: hypothetical protein HC773_20225 [Scytonema sp. CRU_2_7]|nr:hypothetical protein [Scytonema sp. CRU_2_7]